MAARTLDPPPVGRGSAGSLAGNFRDPLRSNRAIHAIRHRPGGRSMTRHLSLVGVLALVVSVLTAPPADAAAPLAITRDGQRDMMLTIYNGNFGLVRDVREVRLPGGTTEVQFVDVAAQIDPTTVHLKSLSDPASLKTLEQNYKYDLRPSKKPMKKYLGQKVGP